MRELKFAGWQKVYQETLTETDHGALVTKICAAESLLSLRLQQMHHEPAHIEEATAIYDAVHSLRLLRCDLFSRTRRDELNLMWKKSA
jgi:hypothetical protein